MRSSIYIITILFLSCNSSTSLKSSFWENKKDDFKYLNKKEFISDSTLEAEIKSLKIVSHQLFDTTLEDKVYLYSWQDRDKSKIEFTVVHDEGELGLKIFYFILDKNDNLISWTQIGGKGSEYGFTFETRSTFKNTDTLINIGATTQWLDFAKLTKLEKTMGDSTFSYLIIDSSGKVTNNIFKKVKELNFGKE
ncbi:MAG TPA: hypothetical protein PKD51_15265 [Saprospiraceae bacterium]|nr:hypothetical protein [Saprospiraceae bacterium]